MVDFVEHVTGKQMLLHLEMDKCSKELMPQSVSRVGHDGKELKDIHEIDASVADDLDPWHCLKRQMDLAFISCDLFFTALAATHFVLTIISALIRWEQHLAQRIIMDHASMIRKNSKF